MQRYGKHQLMKSLFLLPLCLLSISIHAVEPAPTPPTPVAPITAPQKGMRWKISIGKQDPKSEPEMVINGSLGKYVREETLSAKQGAVRQWYIIDSHAYTKLPGSDEMQELNLDDADTNAAKKFYVSGFPGIFQIRATDLQGVTFDKENNRFLATYKKQPAGMIKVGAGDDAMEFPTGPSIPLEATFDATTGLPLFAKVGDKLYIYEITKTGGTDAALPPEVRQKIVARLQRAAALQETIRRQESAGR
jgi:hypothetical protein